MKHTTTATTVLPAGTVLTLDKQQAADRGKLLEPVPGKKNVYRALQSVQFKAGETIEIDGELPKRLQAGADVEPVVKAAKTAKATASVAGAGTGAVAETGTSLGLDLSAQTGTGTSTGGTV